MLKVKVQFTHKYDVQKFGEKQYDYLTIEKDLKEGDMVVVETANGFAVARFVRYVENFDVNSQKWILTVIDIEAFQERKKQAKEAMQLRQRIKERAAAVKEQQEYEQLAKEDTGLKSLLADFKNLFK